jgi:hypothetical protein
MATDPCVPSHDRGVSTALCRTAHPTGIVLAGRKVLADLALPKDEVRALALDRASGTHGAHALSRDRRNLYLVSTTISISPRILPSLPHF